MIGIIGYGMVGKAVSSGFPDVEQVVVDPAYDVTTVTELCSVNPEAIFVCVPTPTDDSNYKILKGVLSEIQQTGYTGLVVVKSTILPNHLDGFDVVYNPEFLSRATAIDDFCNPELLVIGGEDDRALQLLDLYLTKSIVKPNRIFRTDIKTAALVKYTLNSFFATKVAFMNQIYDVSQELGVNFRELTSIVSKHPWMGSHHFQVPGPDGQRGFGGPCLPKDTKALASTFDLQLLKTVLEINNQVRI